MVSGLGDMGLSLSFAAIGSALGTGVAGMAAIGAWKRAFMQNKMAPFILIAFVGAPLSQTIYGMILMGALKGAQPEMQFGGGLLGGLAIGVSAWSQGRAGASASDALAERNAVSAVGVDVVRNGDRLRTLGLEGRESQREDQRQTSEHDPPGHGLLRANRHGSLPFT